MDLFSLLKNPATELDEEQIKNIPSLTCIKDIYRYWGLDIDTESLTLYTGLDADGFTTRYFVNHFNRDWYGGYTYNETTIWYEISEEDYLNLYDFYQEIIF